MTYETFRSGIGVLVKTFRDKEFDTDHLWNMLQDLDDVRFMESVISIANGTQQLYPGTNMIALIREKACSKDELLAGEAFGKMMSQVMRLNPKFDDPITEQTVRAMGWREIGASDISQSSTLRAQFIKIYNSFSERNKHDEINKNVPSLIQQMVKQIEEKK